MNVNNCPIFMHKTYRPDIDGLRAVAILSVVMFHASPNSMPGGFIGVDIFFVISGYLISKVLFEAFSQESFSLTDFYIRRIRRIFPALITVLMFVYVAGWVVLLADEYRQLGKHIAAGAGFVSNLALWSEAGYFDNTAESKPLLHLCVKSRLIVNALFEQFGFFLLPFLQRLNRRKMVERTLWNQLVVSFHIALKRCLQLSC